MIRRLWQNLLGLLRASPARSSPVPAATTSQQDCDLIIDGSNLIYWDGTGPNLDPVMAALKSAQKKKLRVVLYFDANVGYVLTGQHMVAPALAVALHVPAQTVFVAPKGTPADPLFLQHAAQTGARVLSNDRFRDHAKRHKWLRDPMRVVQGQVVNGQLHIAW